MRSLEGKDLRNALLGLAAGALAGRAIQQVDARATAIEFIRTYSDYDRRLEEGTLPQTRIGIPGGRRVADRIIKFTTSPDPRNDWIEVNRMNYADNPLVDMFQIRPSALNGLWYKRVEWTQIVQTSRGGIARRNVLTEIVGYDYLLEPPKYKPRT